MVHPPTKKKLWKRSLWLLLVLFMGMNIIALFHAYKFTHFASSEIQKTADPSQLSLPQKFQTLAFGVNNPRPINEVYPSQSYETVSLKSNKEIECWYIGAENAKGTVIVFHGFSGYKSLMLGQAEVFIRQGYNTLLVDFMGSGGSEGNQTTIGYLEAEQVKTSFDFVKSKGEQNIYLYGTSMGAVAIMKALDDFNFDPSGIILECPFGSMYKTVCARFKMMNAPAFPMAGLLVFWGGVQNGFWAFGHNPSRYAKSISCPTLLLYGAQDKKVSKEEIEEIFANLKGRKELKIYEDGGHEDLFDKKQTEWRQDIEGFMNRQ